MSKLKVNNYDMDSTTLINTIRNSATDIYKERVPVATQENLAKVGDSILSYESTRNEFLHSLIDRIALTVIKSMSFNNPLNIFKKQTLNYGKDIEEVFVDLIKAQSYDSEIAENELFKRHLPDVKTCFYTINRKEFYKVTIEDTQLKRAFLSQEGMVSLVEKIIGSLQTSNQVDEFNLMKHIINVTGQSGKLSSVLVDPIIDESSAKAFATKVKQYSNDLMFPRQDFNYADVTNTTPKAQQVLLINTRADAQIDVELLSQAFNMSKADFEMHKIIVDDFGGLEDVEAILCSADWFIARDTEMKTNSIYNPQGLYTNYFLHVEQILGASVFENAICFKTTDPVLASIDLKPDTASVMKGQALQLTVEGTGTTQPSVKCDYTITGANSEKTSINSVGLLVVGNDETATTITVTATSVLDPLITDSSTITII